MFVIADLYTSVCVCVCVSLAVSCVKVQLFPRVDLAVLGGVHGTGCRTKGALTGSRVAGSLGQVPVCDAMIERSRTMKLYGFKLDGSKSIACAGWIDNLFSFSNSIEGALRISEHVEHVLMARWGLRFRPGSTGGMVCKMEPSQIDRALTDIDQATWPISEVICILGHWIQSDAGIRHDWNLAKKTTWAVFWGNSGSRRAYVLTPFQRVRSLHRTVTRAVAWRMSAWPSQKTIVQELDNLQCKMLCKILPCVPRENETLDSFNRRRQRNARNVAGKIGLWSLLWASRSLAWHKHLTRCASYHFCYDLLNYHGQAWFREQRTPYVTCSRNPATAGQTNTT